MYACMRTHARVCVSVQASRTRVNALARVRARSSVCARVGGCAAPSRLPRVDGHEAAQLRRVELGRHRRRLRRRARARAVDRCVSRANVQRARLGAGAWRAQRVRDEGSRRFTGWAAKATLGANEGRAVRSALPNLAGLARYGELHIDEKIEEQMTLQSQMLSNRKDVV
eukprot:6204805-Pleurochrysis_carterae.AAC.2